MQTYSLRDAANILKVSPARLRYWKRTTLAQLDDPEGEVGRASSPSLQPDFDFRDLVCVRAMLSLLDRGISVRRIGRAVAVLQENVPDLEDPLAALRLWSDGSERIVVQHEGVLIEPEGQMVLDFRSSEEPANISTSITQSSSQGSHAPTSPDNAYEDLMSQFERGCCLDSDAATYDEAMNAYRACIDIDPSFSDAHCNLGAVLYNAGHAERARRSFERCLEINPRHVEAHFNLANLLEEKGCDEMAMSHYRAALRADPFYSELHVNMALLYERLKVPLNARDHWRRYLQLDPDGAWAEVARQRLTRGPGF